MLGQYDHWQSPLQAHAAAKLSEGAIATEKAAEAVATTAALDDATRTG